MVGHAFIAIVHSVLTICVFSNNHLLLQYPYYYLLLCKECFGFYSNFFIWLLCGVQQLACGPQQYFLSYSLTSRFSRILRWSTNHCSLINGKYNNKREIPLGKVNRKFTNMYMLTDNEKFKYILLFWTFKGFIWHYFSNFAVFLYALCMPVVSYVAVFHPVSQSPLLTLSKKSHIIKIQ